MNSQYEHYDTQSLNAIPIVGVAERLGKVKRAGSVYKTLCPWHDDKHPSLTLYERTGENHCYCFSCGKGGSVIDLVMQSLGYTFKDACEWLSREYGISKTSHEGHLPPPKVRETVVKEEPTYTYIPVEMTDELVSSENSLCRCLMRMFQPEAVELQCEEYRIGCYAMNGLDDYTVFPSIDWQGRVCNLKVQHYDTDPASPRFCHNDQNTYWLGAIWSKEGRLPQGAQFRSDCLFGEHLLPRYPESIVALVESPKNAMFGALAFPQMTWVATGNKGALKRETLQPLRSRDVIVIPDRDAIQEWKQTLKGMADLANFTVSDFCRQNAPDGQMKYDIADYLQRRMLTR